MKKRAMTISAVLAIACLLPGTIMAASDPINLWVNNDVAVTDESMGEAYINDAGRTMVPLRLVNDYLGYNTKWTSDGRIHVTGDNGALDVTLQVGSVDYVSNGAPGKFGTPPLVQNGRTYLPARDFSELHGSIYWDGESRTVWMIDTDTPLYRVMGRKIVRARIDGQQVMNISGENGVSAQRGDYVNRVKVEKDGTAYVAVNYDNDASGRGLLFRDDGDKLTCLEVRVNGTSSFAVDGDVVYHTMGTKAGPWTNAIDPHRLLLSTADTEKTYTLDFAVNECDLTMEKGKLIAIAPDGARHVIDFNMLSPNVK